MIAAQAVIVVVTVGEGIKVSAGKGDDYRRVNKKEFDKNFDTIFGKKDIEEYHRDKTKDNSKDHADVA